MTMPDKQFSGFSKPKSNYSKLPHVFIECLPLISSLAELKVILYVLRHTWGYSEFDRPKRITLDEFQNGRKRKNGNRLDSGINMSTNAIKDGIHRAIEQGFLVRFSDERDKARSSHEYILNMRVSEVDSLPSEVDSLPSRVSTRSEKETLETNHSKFSAEAENTNQQPAAEETGEELQQEQEQHQAQDTTFDAIMGERQHSIPRGDPVQSDGDWATRRQDQPWATWGEHSKEAQAQFARRDGMAQSLRQLGYELDTTLGLRPLWKQKRSVASWFVGLANCLAEAEGDVDLVLEAANHLREQEMTLSSPHSLVKTTGALAAKRRSGNSGTISIGL